jgi:hypothetical protein
MLLDHPLRFEPLKSVLGILDSSNFLAVGFNRTEKALFDHGESLKNSARHLFVVSLTNSRPIRSVP